MCARVCVACLERHLPTCGVNAFPAVTCSGLASDRAAPQCLRFLVLESQDVSSMAFTFSELSHVSLSLSILGGAPQTSLLIIIFTSCSY